MTTPRIPEDVSVAELLTRIDAGWAAYHGLLAGLDDAALAGPADAAGWTAQDHMTHVAAWEAGIHADLERRPRWAAMGVEPADLAEAIAARDFDAINAAIREGQRGMDAAAARAYAERTHAAMRTAVAALADEDLLRPYADFKTDAADPAVPLLPFVVGNTFGHYAEHAGYIEAILGERG